MIAILSKCYHAKFDSLFPLAHKIVSMYLPTYCDFLTSHDKSYIMITMCENGNHKILNLTLNSCISSINIHSLKHMAAILKYNLVNKNNIISYAETHDLIKKSLDSISNRIAEKEKIENQKNFIREMSKCSKSPRRRRKSISRKKSQRSKSPRRRRRRND